MRIPPPLVIGPLDETAAGHVRDLAAAATEADGVAPLSEQALLTLTTDSPELTHALARNRAGTVVGYARVDRGGEAASAEIVVHPEHRRRRTGRMLLKVARHDATMPSHSGQPGDARKGLRVWAHGDLPATRAFAAASGLVVVRELLLLERPLAGAGEGGPAGPGTAENVVTGSAGPATTAPAVTGPSLPSGLALRPFGPHDADRWVSLNAAAFADHPEQGRLTSADLAARQAEDWYDPAGLVFLEEAATGTALGYIWTKVPTGQPDDVREGEIYAVGVDPSAQGRGLGRILLEVGLDRLAADGVRTAVLYVDGDNTAAVGLYERAGFTRRAVDVQYAVAP